MKINFCILIIVMSTLLVSCNKNNPDLEGNWIKLKQYEDSLDSEGQSIEKDTINVNFGDEFLIEIYSQYQPECELIISKRINDNSPNNITDSPEGAKLVGYFTEDGITRKINEIGVCFSESLYSHGDKITYTTEIKSPSEIKVLRNLTIEIE